MPVTLPPDSSARHQPPDARHAHPAAALSTSVWEASIRQALRQAGQALSALTNQDVTVKETAVEFVPLAQFPQLAGAAETPTIAGLQEISGTIPGLLLLLFPAWAAAHLVELMLSPYLDESAPAQAASAAGPAATGDEAANADLDSVNRLLEDEMAVSVLAEVDNVVGSAFLNEVADSVSGRLVPSPPAIVADMAGALLSTALASTLDRAGRVADTVSVVHTSLGTHDDQVEAMLIWLSAATSAEIAAAIATRE